MTLMAAGGFTHLRQRAVELLLAGRDAGPERPRQRAASTPGKLALEHLKDIGIDIDGFIASDLGGQRRLAELHRLGG